MVERMAQLLNQTPKSSQDASQDEKRVFTPQDFVSPDQIERNGVRPFQRGEKVKNPDGTFSTERTISINIGGKEVVVPSLFMSPRGPVDFSRDPQRLKQVVMDFEQRTGKKFPRFNNPEEAIEFAKQRSREGGASIKPLFEVK